MMMRLNKILLRAHKKERNLRSLLGNLLMKKMKDNPRTTI